MSIANFKSWNFSGDRLLGDQFDETTFQWKINNFSSLPNEKDTFYESPVFSSAFYSWSLRLYPNGESRHSSDGWFGLYFKFLTRGEGVSDFHLVAGIQDINGDVKFQKNIYKLFSYGVDGSGWIRFLERRKLMQQRSEFLPMDRLTIHIWLKYLIPKEKLPKVSLMKVGNVLVGGPSKEKIEVKGLSLLSEHWEEMFLRKKGCDVTIHVKGKSFSVHKSVLMARSEVLSSMITHDLAEKKSKKRHKKFSEVLSSIFKHDMTEKKSKKSNVIKIVDCEPEAFKVFLLYLYTGKNDKLSNTNMLSVYYIADKYDCPYLKAQCVSYIKCCLSIKDICDVIRVSRKHGDKELLDCATNYFAGNVHEIIQTVEWQAFLKEFPKFGNELLCKIR